MDVIIQSLGFTAGEELESFIQEKLSKLKPDDQIVRANVTLYLGPDRATPNNYCEIRLEVPGPDLFVKEHSAEFHQAVDECVNKLNGMLKKAKEKNVDRWHARMNTDGPEGDETAELKPGEIDVVDELDDGDL